MAYLRPDRVRVRSFCIIINVHAQASNCLLRVIIIVVVFVVICRSFFVHCLRSHSLRTSVCSARQCGTAAFYMRAKSLGGMYTKDVNRGVQKFVWCAKMKI